MTEEAKPLTFVSLVLARMDTNPSEFIEGDPNFRWSHLVDAIRAHVAPNAPIARLGASPAPIVHWALDKEELDALAAKYRQIYRSFLKTSFLKHLLEGNGFAYIRASEPLGFKHATIREAAIDSGVYLSDGPR